MGNMRNLKELMKDDSGIGMMENCLCGCIGPMVCHGMNCIGSIDQSVCIALATLITNIWTSVQAGGIGWHKVCVDSMSNMVGK